MSTDFINYIKTSYQSHDRSIYAIYSSSYIIKWSCIPVFFKRALSNEVIYVYFSAMSATLFYPYIEQKMFEVARSILGKIL